MNIFNYEPIQVEIFQNVLKSVNDKKPLMIELGCGEAEYSKIFNDYFSGNCHNICLDILPRQLEEAKKNCPNAKIIHGYVGVPLHIQEIPEFNYGAERIDLSELIGDKKVNILHMDIQGSETYVMEELHSLDSTFKNIEYIFISLHNTQEEVKKYIPDNFEFLYDHPTEGGLGDGLIVLKNKKYDGDQK